MREFNNLHAVYLDAPADPRLHGIARGLGQLFAADDDTALPDRLSDLVRRLDLRDDEDWDGPDRDGTH